MGTDKVPIVQGQSNLSAFSLFISIFLYLTTYLYIYLSHIHPGRRRGATSTAAAGGEAYIGRVESHFGRRQITQEMMYFGEGEIRERERSERGGERDSLDWGTK